MPVVATAVRGVSMWSRFQPDRGLDFNSWLVENGDGTAFVVDPLDPDDALLAHCRAAGVADVVITNRDHQRAAARFVADLGCRVHAPGADADEIGVTVDRRLHDGDDVFGWRVFVLDGFKTAGECVLYDARRRAAISGDAFWGAPAGLLTLMADAKLADPVRAARSARRIRMLPLQALLVGDGAPVFRDAAAVLGAALDARGDAGMHVVNIDDDHGGWLAYDDEPAPFGGSAFETDAFLGQSALASRVVRLPAGAHMCPYHWHTSTEELFYVVAGTPSMRTADGVAALRPGSLYAATTGPRGAHRLYNDGPDEATVLIVSNDERDEVCFYPDSRKLMVEATGAIVRSEPELDYFDGEVPA